jgi:hypothetical protein
MAHHIQVQILNSTTTKTFTLTNTLWKTQAEKISEELKDLAKEEEEKAQREKIK